MADIEKRTSKDGKIVRYRARIRLKGKPVIYASFSTRSKALEWWNRTSAEAREGKYFKTNANSVFSELAIKELNTKSLKNSPL